MSSSLKKKPRTVPIRGKTLRKSDRSVVSDSEGSVTSNSESDGDSEGEANTSSDEDNRPAKRLRASIASTNKGTSRHTRAKKSLSLISTLPLDILFEILSYLGPKELASIYKLNKQFYESLSSTHAVSIWKNARKAFNAPEPPLNLSERRWVTLIWGNICEACDASTSQAPDFGLLRRVCSKCRKNFLLPASRFGKSYYWVLDPLEDIQSLIPHSKSFTGHGRVYWRWDVNRVLHAWQRLKAECKAGRPGAERRLEEYETQQFQLARRIARNADRSSEWYHEMLRQLRLAKEQIGRNRREEIYRRLRALEYQQCDIEAALRRDPQVGLNKELTELTWKRMKPLFEKAIEREVQQRAFGLLQPLYNSYLMTLPLNEWMCYPQLEQILKREKIQRIMRWAYRETDAEVITRFNTKVLPRLPLAGTKLKREQKIVYEKAVMEYLSSSGQSIQVESVLDLALWVFMCQTCSYGNSSRRQYNHLPFFGWDSTKIHGNHSLFVSEAHVDAIGSIIGLANMDPSQTTSQEMDKKNFLFYCDACAPGFRNPNGTCPDVFNWREAATHVVNHSDMRQKLKERSPRLKILDAKQWASIQEARGTIANWCAALRRRESWSCNHCPANFLSLKPYHVVEEHVKQIHEIVKPQCTVDLVQHPSKRSTRDPKIKYEFINPQTSN